MSRLEDSTSSQCPAPPTIRPGRIDRRGAMVPTGPAFRWQAVRMEATPLRYQNPVRPCPMKLAFTLFGLGMALMANAAPLNPLAALVTNAPACIDLPDQFEVRHKLTFPATNLLLLTIADHEGSKQVASWVAPVHSRYGPRVAISGIAAVSAVPGWLRGVVRRQFRQQQSYPVLLDWSGATVKAFASAPDCVNVFVVDEQGRILNRFTGEAQARNLAALYSTIDLALAGNKHSVTPP